MPPQYELRPATEADRAALLAIHLVAFRESVEATWGWDDADQRRRFTDRFDPATSQLVVVGGETIGQLVAVEEEHEVFLYRIVLRPDWQSRGIGTRIVAEVVARARASGRPTRLHVLRASVRARALYERLGFHVFGGDEHRHYMRTE